MMMLTRQRSTTSIVAIDNVEYKAGHSIAAVEQPVEHAVEIQQAIEANVTGVVEEHVIAITANEIVADEVKQPDVDQKPSSDQQVVEDYVIDEKIESVDSNVENIVEEHIAEQQVAEEVAVKEQAVEHIVECTFEPVVEEAEVMEQIMEKHVVERSAEKATVIGQVEDTVDGLQEHGLSKVIDEQPAIGESAKEHEVEEVTIGENDGALHIVSQQLIQSELHDDKPITAQPFAEEPAAEEPLAKEAVTVVVNSDPTVTLSESEQRQQAITNGTAAWNDWSKKNEAEHQKLMVNTPGSMEHYAKILAEAKKTVVCEPSFHSECSFPLKSLANPFLPFYSCFPSSSTYAQVCLGHPTPIVQLITEQFNLT